LVVGGENLARDDASVKVLSAARNVFSREGYRGTTVSHILKEAGISRGTFYKHFPNKRQVFYEILASIFHTLLESSREILTEELTTLESRMRRSLELSYRLFLDNRGIIVVYFREAFRIDPGFYALWDDFEKRIISLFAEILSKGIGSGEFRQVDPGLISRAMFLLFLQVPYWDILLGGIIEIDVEAMADEMVKFVMDGISAGTENTGENGIGGIFEGHLG
jgi:AcrR family transcriptional regulator